jgi:hypothetical protein
VFVKLDLVGCGKISAAFVAGNAAAVLVIVLAVVVAAYNKERLGEILSPLLWDNRPS